MIAFVSVVTIFVSATPVTLNIDSCVGDVNSLKRQTQLELSALAKDEDDSLPLEIGVHCVDKGVEIALRRGEQPPQQRRVNAAELSDSSANRLLALTIAEMVATNDLKQPIVVLAQGTQSTPPEPALVPVPLTAPQPEPAPAPKLLHHEIGLRWGSSSTPVLTEHALINASYAYNFTDTLAVEVRGGYSFARWTNVAKDTAELVEFTLSRRRGATESLNDLKDAWMMETNGTVGVRFAPLSARIPFLFRSTLDWKGYLLLGAGLAEFYRTSFLFCKEGNATSCQVYKKEGPRVGAVITGALGSQLRVGERHALHFEIRDYAYPDNYRVDVDATVARNGGDSGVPAKDPGTTHMVQFDFGYSFLF